MHPCFLNLTAKHFKAEDLDKKVYDLWEKHNVNAGGDTTKKPFSIVIPPPNVTGRLHLGHALNGTIQDVIIRFKRMDGYDAVWIPGTDHAGISTQSVVKKHIDAEGLSFRDLGREKVVERIWKWKERYGNTISNQFKALGCSCDWSRERFTMDEGLSNAVNVSFKRLYDAGLVYRAKYIVNWCPEDRTALSNDEIHTKEGGEPGFLWHFKYPIAGEDKYVVIATTRPETMFGDTAVAVSPKDQRYTNLIGKNLILPLSERPIPIIGDNYVDLDFGTGCLKVTPAHDPNDFEIGNRHNLPRLNIMHEDATLNENVPLRFQGLDRFVARELVVKELKELGLVVKIEERMTPVARAERSKAIIEYRLSDQWFVKMKPLAEEALKSDKITFFPARWESVYRSWLENTKDWCISRQIWWGHRIPAWYNKTTGEILVDSKEPSIVAEARDSWVQDEDVLDTWFSSCLWPYSTFGWPQENHPDLHRYYPTSVLSTAKDIIYLWVARMVMTGLFHVGEIPFRHVYIHPVICDEEGDTMSKSRGNGIDPLHVINGASLTELEGPLNEARPSNIKELLIKLRSNFPNGFNGVGADAFRFTLLTLNSEAQQVQVSLKRFEEVGRPFTDKLWNASRYVIGSLNEISTTEVEIGHEKMVDQWIVGQLDNTIAGIRECIDQYKFNSAFEIAYHFFWDDFCDWYVELSKSRLKSENFGDIKRVQVTLAHVLSTIIRALHPAVPFITEELWGHLLPVMIKNHLITEFDTNTANATICALAPYPLNHNRYQQNITDNFDKLRAVVKSLRTIKIESGIKPSAKIAVWYRSDLSYFFKLESDIICTSSGLLHFLPLTEERRDLTVVVLPEIELFIDIATHRDIGAEITKAEREYSKLELRIEAINKKLANEEFVARAPINIVNKEKEILVDIIEQANKLKDVLKELKK
jgi:valyl-tRNA synthetase